MNHTKKILIMFAIVFNPLNGYAFISYSEYGNCMYGCNTGSTSCAEGFSHPSYSAESGGGPNLNVCVGASPSAGSCNEAAAANCGPDNYVTDSTASTPGTTASYDFSPGHWENVMNGGWQDPYCNFTCTGVGSGICPTTEPLVFEETSEPGQPLHCSDSNFTASGNTCQQLADQTCQQTIYYPNNTSGGSGHIIDPSMPPPPPPPPWINFPNPGVAIFDFSPESYGDNDLVIPPYCNFTCTGHGQVCPSGFTQTSSENELLSCEDLTFNHLPVTWEGCEQIAQASCLNTNPNDDQPFWWYWNANSPSIQFNSIIGPQGETLDAVQYFNNMAIQQLMNAHIQPVSKSDAQVEK